MTIDKALDMVEELKELYDTDKATKRNHRYGKKIEGCVPDIFLFTRQVLLFLQLKFRLFTCST